MSIGAGVDCAGCSIAVGPVAASPSDGVEDGGNGVG